jgi:uncharacterized Zn-finger protein
MKPDLRMALSSNTQAHNTCPLCSLAFHSKQALRLHQIDYHSITIRLKCTDCEKTFSTTQSLSQHRRLHTALKPHVCRIDGCRQRFRQGSQLSAHKRSHRRVRILPCIVEVEETEAMKLTDCLRDLSSLDVVRAQHEVRPEEIQLPSILAEKPAASALPSLQFLLANQLIGP